MLALLVVGLKFELLIIITNSNSQRRESYRAVMNGYNTSKKVPSSTAGFHQIDSTNNASSVIIEVIFEYVGGEQFVPRSVTRASARFHPSVTED